MPVYVLGINAYHADAAACLLRDGHIVAAVEEERYTRMKHCSGFPAHAVRYCLSEAGITLADVGHVAINQDGGANRWRKLGYLLAARPQPGLVLKRLRNKRSRENVADELARAAGVDAFPGTVHRVEHHLSHLASAFFVSPFREAVALSVDGFGDFASAAWGLGSARGLEVDGKVYFPHSLGIFYQAITQYLGFPHYGDEYKVMGLAPYGEPRCMDAMRRLVRLQDDGAYRLDLGYFRHHREVVSYGWGPDDGAAGPLYSPALADLLGPPRSAAEELTERHMDIARSAQVMYEEALFHLLGRLRERYGCDALAMAGGCAQNSVANGKIRRSTGFRELYVQPAAGDSGGAMGAALVAWQRVARDGTRQAPANGARVLMDHAYWGPQFSGDAIGAVLASHAQALSTQRCVCERVSDEQMLCEKTAAAIAAGRVVGWFQGRMEWGPRALGNRSLLGDPRRADMKEILNLKIKRRESFRPFAPSILREAVGAWFEADEDVPFMTEVYPVRVEKRTLIPAVTHADGTGRLQTVTRETNGRYYRLIREFQRLTGVPIVLNTSFNENEPVVCEPGEALGCFLRTRMDMLILGDYVVERMQ